MSTVAQLGELIATRRKALGLSQAAAAKSAGIGHSTLEALENGRLGELGIAKIMRLLAVLGLELTVQEAAHRRPTLDELLKEGRDDQGLDR